MDQNTPIPKPAAQPQRTTLHGLYIRLEPLHPAGHTEALWQELGGLAHEGLWL